MQFGVLEVNLSGEGQSRVSENSLLVKLACQSDIEHYRFDVVSRVSEKIVLHVD